MEALQILVEENLADNSNRQGERLVLIYCDLCFVFMLSFKVSWILLISTAGSAKKLPEWAHLLSEKYEDLV